MVVPVVERPKVRHLLRRQRGSDSAWRRARSSAARRASSSASSSGRIQPRPLLALAAFGGSSRRSSHFTQAVLGESADAGVVAHHHGDLGVCDLDDLRWGCAQESWHRLRLHSVRSWRERH